MLTIVFFLAASITRVGCSVVPEEVSALLPRKLLRQPTVDSPNDENQTPQSVAIDIPIETVAAATAAAASALLLLADSETSSTSSYTSAADPCSESAAKFCTRDASLGSRQPRRRRKGRNRFNGDNIADETRDHTVARLLLDNDRSYDDDGDDDVTYEGYYGKNTNDDGDDDVTYDDDGGDDDVTYDDDGGDDDVTYDDRLSDSLDGNIDDDLSDSVAQREGGARRRQEVSACLLRHFADLDSGCRESVSGPFSNFGGTMGAAPACDLEVRSYCNSHLASLFEDDADDGPFNNTATSLPSLAFDCLAAHYDELGDPCRARVDKHLKREHLIPSSFLEARYYLLTQVATFAALVVLLIPLLVSFCALRKALRIQHAIRLTAPTVDDNRSGGAGALRGIDVSSLEIKCPSACAWLFRCCCCCCLLGWKALRGIVDLAIVLYDPIGPETSVGGYHTTGTDEDILNMGGLASISFVRLSYWGKQPAAAADVERAPTNKCRGIVKKQQQGQRRPRSTDCDKSRLLFNVSGSVRRGEMVAVMGPSGSGKTTLLRLLGGHTRTGAMAGHRRINGKDLAAKTYEAVLRQHSGFVEQSDATMLGEWNLTVWETVAYASLLRLPTGTSLSARLDRASEVVRSLGLDLCANTVVSGKKGGSSRRPVGGDDRRNRGGNTRRSSDAGGGNGEGGGQISGGQLRRLQIALEMLRSPGALFLDEPTSGLDSASSLVLVSRLSDLSKASAVGSEAPPPMVVATIHQPRADVLALFDVLLLLKEGRLVYAGRPSDCGPHFASIPQVALNPATYENPADFVMDSLDARNLRPFTCSFTTRRSLLEKTDDGENLSLTSGLSVKNLSNRGTHSRGAIEMTSSNFGMEESFGLIPDDGEERKLSDNEQSQESSSEEDETKPMLASSAAAPTADYSPRSIAGRLRVAMHTTMRRFEWSRHGPDFNCSEDDDASSNHVPPAEGLVEAFEKSSFLFHAHNMRLDERQQNESLAVQSEGRQKSGGGLRVSSSSASSPNSLVLSEQTIVLFTRRTHRQMVDWQGIVVSHLQVLGIATTVAFAFSYDVDDGNQAVGVPYQAYMCLLLTSSYAFMNSYFLLPSEYLDERPLVEAERLRGHLRFESYLTATFLGELPRGFWHVVLTLGPAYLVHGLNPSSTSRCFAVVCLAVGVAAWQGVICICAAATTNVTAATLLAFLFFGGGTLFGGLLIEYENIPMIFRPAYHLSVTAVTQRALIVNDFICCYITLPCGGAGNSGDHGGGNELFGGNDGAVHFSTQAVSTAASYLGVSRGSDEPACPEGVDEHQGNLGRKALELLGLDGVDDYAALATLFTVAIASRVVALLVLKQRERWGRKLHSHHAPSASVQKQAV